MKQFKSEIMVEKKPIKTLTFSRISTEIHREANKRAASNNNTNKNKSCDRRGRDRNLASN